jgi:pyruvate dehydrogenase E2 component (dihydrolipoamide acetyltransferase)
MIKNNQKVSMNDFIIKALALALRIVPELNSNYNEKDNSFGTMSTVDVSVAVATDKGLITPIVKNADKLSIIEIGQQVKILADKAR